MKLPADYTTMTQPERRQVREEYRRLQADKCHYCNEPLTTDAAPRVLKKRINRRLFPPSFFNHPIHLHHDHNTGMTIGAVHNVCNAVLWQYHGE